MRPALQAQRRSPATTSHRRAARRVRAPGRMNCTVELLRLRRHPGAGSSCASGSATSRARRRARAAVRRRASSPLRAHCSSQTWSTPPSARVATCRPATAPSLSSRFVSAAVGAPDRVECDLRRASASSSSTRSGARSTTSAIATPSRRGVAYSETSGAPPSTSCASTSPCAMRSPNAAPSCLQRLRRQFLGEQLDQQRGARHQAAFGDRRCRPASGIRAARATRRTIRPRRATACECDPCTRRAR